MSSRLGPIAVVLLAVACSARDLDQYQAGGGAASGGGGAASGGGGAASGGGGAASGGGGAASGGGTGGMTCNPPCTATKICKSNNTCVDCLSDADCPSDKPHCQNQQSCRECLVDSHCGGAEACGADWKCTKKCSSNADCTSPSHPLCNLSVGYCVQCLSSADCDGKPCKSNHTCED